jgi:hypothetical protein
VTFANGIVVRERIAAAIQGMMQQGTAAMKQTLEDGSLTRRDDDGRHARLLSQPRGPQ